MKNPIIGETQQETIDNAAEAMSSFVILLANHDSYMCKLIMPIMHALNSISSASKD